MPRFYLQGTGATCYDGTGITFPERLALDWQAVVGPHLEDRPEVEWRRRRDNQPEELTFTVATRAEAEAVVDRLESIIQEAGLVDTGFIVSLWPEDIVEAEALVGAALGEVEGLRDQAPVGTRRRTELTDAANGLRRALENLAAAGAAGEEKGLPGMEVIDLDPAAPQLGPGEGLWRYIDTGGNREYGEIIGGERDGMKVRFDPPAEPRPEGERPLAYAGSPFPGAVLTSEHATSSYGRPVLVIGGEGYGPGDVLSLPDGGMIGARDWVRAAHRHRERECRDEGPLPAPW